MSFESEVKNTLTESERAVYRRSAMWLKFRLAVWLLLAIVTLEPFNKLQDDGHPWLAVLIGLPFCIYTLYVVVTSLIQCPSCKEDMTKFFLKKEVPNPWARKCPKCGVSL